MRIKMLKDQHGAPEGHTVKLFKKGEEYNVPEGFGKAFVANKEAEEVIGAKAAEPAKNKAEKVAKNKAEKEE